MPNHNYYYNHWYSKSFTHLIHRLNLIVILCKEIVKKDKYNYLGMFAVYFKISKFVVYSW